MANTQSPSRGAAAELKRPMPADPVGRPAPSPIPTAGSQPPQIQGLSAGSGVPGDGFSIVGSGFTGTDAVIFRNTSTNALTGAPFTVFWDSDVLANVPNVPPGVYGVSVEAQTSLGPQTSNEAAFTVLQPVTPPTLDPTDPFDPIGAAVGQIVTIHGRNLGQVNEVDFGSGSSKNVKVVGGKTIMATVPNDASTGPIRVSGPTGQATSAIDFVLVTAPPTITGIVPNSGKPKAKVEIDGAQLRAATITFGGAQAKVNERAERRLKVVVPQLAPGTVTVVATNALGSAQSTFTVTA